MGPLKCKKTFLLVSRLISAWKDKFFSLEPLDEFFLKKYARRAIAKFRRNATEEDLKTGEGLRFKEFLQIVVFDSKEGR